MTRLMVRLTAILILFTTMLLTGCKPSPQGVEAFHGVNAATLYKQGVNDMNKRFYSTATKKFEAIDALYPFSQYAEKSLLNVIYTYYKDGDMPSSGAAAERYIHLYPRSRNVDYAYYMKGITSLRRDRSMIYNYFNLDPSKRDLSGARDAFADFRALITLFPHSQYASDAQKRMIYIREVLARHELLVAKFYYDRKAYVAAANRASNVVEHYEGSTEVEPALRMMVASYNKLGKHDLAADARKTLRANYPDRMG